MRNHLHHFGEHGRNDTLMKRRRPPKSGLTGSQGICKKMFTLLDLCVSSLRRGHANLLCIVPILTDDPRRESKWQWTGPLGCTDSLQPSGWLQTARAPGRPFVALASAVLSRHFACMRRRDCQAQRQESDTCGVRTHADRSTRT
jgi:hypothetical protein